MGGVAWAAAAAAAVACCGAVAVDMLLDIMEYATTAHVSWDRHTRAMCWVECVLLIRMRFPCQRFPFAQGIYICCTMAKYTIEIRVRRRASALPDSKDTLARDCGEKLKCAFVHSRNAELAPILSSARVTHANHVPTPQYIRSIHKQIPQQAAQKHDDRTNRTFCSRLSAIALIQGIIIAITRRRACAPSTITTGVHERYVRVPGYSKRLHSRLQMQTIDRFCEQSIGALPSNRLNHRIQHKIASNVLFRPSFQRPKHRLWLL